MRILLIGERGQLGQEIIKSNIFSDYDLITVNSNDLNLEDEKNIKQYIQSINPEIIINAAAYTDVDEAEIKKQKELWWKVHKEDHEICERLQEGRASSVAISGGLLSPHWENSVRAFHEIMIKSIKKSSNKRQ